MRVRWGACLVWWCCALGVSATGCSSEEAEVVRPGPDPLACDPRCENGGTCTGTSCDCLFTDFGGAGCTERIDDCAGVDCMNGGTCVDENRGFSCDCTGTWAPNAETGLCTSVVTRCADEPCLNGGVCTDIAEGVVECDCTGTGFTGQFCQGDSDECASNPCMNGGECINGQGAFTCNCDATDYEGDTCETLIDDCASVDCMNGGTCVDGVRSFSCSCMGDWSADPGTGLCTVEVTNCAASNPCMNGGVCMDLSPSGVSCDCSGATGYTGAFCDECASGYVMSNANPGTCVEDPCAVDPCAALGGGCGVDASDQAVCECGDSAQGGNETGVDCGGSDCVARCAAGAGCVMDDDCEPGLTCNVPMGANSGTCE